MSNQKVTKGRIVEYFFSGQETNGFKTLPQGLVSAPAIVTQVSDDGTDARLTVFLPSGELYATSVILHKGYKPDGHVNWDWFPIATIHPKEEEKNAENHPKIDPEDAFVGFMKLLIDKGTTLVFAPMEIMEEMHFCIMASNGMEKYGPFSISKATAKNTYHSEPILMSEFNTLSITKALVSIQQQMAKHE